MVGDLPFGIIRVMNRQMVCLEKLVSPELQQLGGVPIFFQPEAWVPIVCGVTDV